MTTFRIGGPCEYFFEPQDAAQLKEALKFCAAKKIPVHILGAGSNILAPDKGLKGLVIRLRAKSFRKCSQSGGMLCAGSGTLNGALLAYCRKNNLSGLEFLAGIPGTLGGSLMGNAGAWGSSLGERVHSVGVLDRAGRARVISAKNLKFAYRRSSLKKYVILWARLKVQKCPDPERLEENIKQLVLKRRAGQGDRFPNAGCVFRNPVNASAGRLIDACGLKGKSFGGAQISQRHANFILNRGQAGSGDVLGLMELIQEKVEKKFGIKLHPEIVIWK